MTLVLSKSPAAVSLVGNDIPFKINTDNQYSNSGLNAQRDIYWSVVDTDGLTFNIAWGNNSIDFECATTPDDSGTQYEDATGTTLNDWMENRVMPALKENYLLSKDFDISYVSATNKIRLDAKSKGTAYTTTITANTSNILSPVSISGIDPVTRDNYRIVVSSFLSGTEDELLGEDSLEPDADGNALFRIQEYLKEEVAATLTWPEDNTAIVVAHTDHIKKFFIKYAEKYDTTVYKLFSSDFFYAIPGKLDDLKIVNLEENSLSFLNEITENLSFLSFHPLEKTISKWQPEKLYYLNFTEATELNVKIKKIYSNQSSISTLETIRNTEQYDVYEICCGHNFLGLQYYSLEVVYYEIWVENQDSEIVSEVRKFIIDQQYREFELAFIFLNSPGAYEIFRTTGLQEKTNEFSHTIIDLVVTEGDLNYTKQHNSETFLKEIFTANSGWITKEELDWTNEFIVSEDRYLIDEYFELVPILITSKKIFQHADDNTLYSIEFEYKIPINSNPATRKNNLVSWDDETGEAIQNESEEIIYL